MIITIDGPSGTGKSTVAKKIAQLLKLSYIDTGAMFRSYGFGLLQHNIEPTDENQVITFIKKTPLYIRGDSIDKRFFLEDQEVTQHLRRQDVAEASSKLSTIVSVRELLKEMQRDFGRSHDCIFCGRDMGTIIFPHADLKIYLTADAHVRAQRRYNELESLGQIADLDVIEKEIRIRDERDQTRAIAPLKPAIDAHIIDTSNYSVDAVVASILSLLKN